MDCRPSRETGHPGDLKRWPEGLTARVSPLRFSNGRNRDTDVSPGETRKVSFWHLSPFQMISTARCNTRWNKRIDQHGVRNGDNRE